MKKIILVLSCILLASCGPPLKENVSYKVEWRMLNNDNTFNYGYEYNHFFGTTRTVNSKKLFHVGERFTISINKVE
jgi:hypothetical protein